MQTAHGQQQPAPPQAFSPDELFAVEAEGGLTQERRHELVPVDLVDPAPHGPLPLSCKLFVGSLFHRGFVCQGKKELNFKSETQQHESQGQFRHCGKTAKFISITLIYR